MKKRRALTTVIAGAAALIAATLPGAAHADNQNPGKSKAAAQRISVDLAASEGPVLHGANGALYGLSDDGVPSDAALAPLKLTTISQKPEGGAQHPNGDALTVSKSFFRNGGDDIYILLQDMYTQWPYQDLGIDDYLPKVEKMAKDVAGAPHSERFVYVPFNEPDQIWYKLNSSDPAAYQKGRDRFFAEWKTVHQRIRSIDPDARIAGPNEAGYDTRFLPEFLTWAKANNVLPDVMTWHELSSGSLKDFQGHYDHYRALEKSVGISPRPISIDEYANRRDLSVPGQLVQWVSMFERNKVYANQAYWDAAGNLSGNVVRSNIPNGGWWFFRWYAGMTGRTVKVTPPTANAIDTLQGLASYDPSRKQAQILVGGSAGDTDVAVQHVDRGVFGSRVVATVSEAEWSGYEGAAAPPRVLSRSEVKVGADGSVTVPLTGMKTMSAYRITLTPAGTGTPRAATVPWSASYEAEDPAKATITDGQVYTQGTVSNANGYAASGTKDVGSLNKSSSKVAFDVDVPKAGDYDLAIFYGNQTGAPSTQTLTVDGGSASSGERTVTYPSTLNWTYRGIQHVTVRLSAGSHTLTLAHDKGEATLDKIDLTAATTPAASYEATLADPSGSPRYDYSSAAGVGTGSLVLDGQDSAVFDVYAPRDGYYTVTPSGSGAPGAPVELALHGTTTTTAPGKAERLFLTAGNNRVTATSATGSAVRLSSLEVTGAGDTKGLASYEAESGTLGGAAAKTSSDYASGGAYVGSLGDGAANNLKLTVQAPSAGRYMLIVHYANNQRADGHQYNTNIISRTADIAVGGGAAQRVAFKNTWTWDDYWGLGVPVDLTKGANTLTFSNASSYAPNIDRVQLAPVTG
ncbi:CBM35 domain-containing protein [Streptomyces sp. ME19-01-6]|uniref:CBM35 domain-containing protein n=1 Tax=Streptomyces sp. ME19-01-6 TaxID=3028686 RepID=UPI0029AB8ABB|nr:CBM35 domain-containing protein [Streptomyces sp. ME19-01-6]MDX3224462.1 CBM35 domain-containing protein [Streptomyces sp. ME19-01-6]